MKRVRPRPLAATIHKALLTPEEDFVLKRIQGELSVSDLAALTGIDEGRIAHIVDRLASRGAVAVEVDAPPAAGAALPPAEAGTTSLADFASALGLAPPEAAPKRATPPPPQPTRPKTSSIPPPPVPTVANAFGARPPSVPPPATGEASLADFASALGMDPRAFGASPKEVAADEPEEIEEDDASVLLSEVIPIAETSTMDELVEVPDDEQALPPLDDEPATNAVSAEDEAEIASRERNYRRIYQSKYHLMTTDARVAAAKTASGSDLYALCFDPEPRIVAAIMENHNVGLDHIRMLAAHHRTGTGLEMISRRHDFLRDMLVERRLLRNPQLGDVVLERIMAPKRILPTYKIAIDRDIPELTRAKSRGQLRKKWQSQATSEERADILIRTEARCLALLTGCTFDAKTTQILCGRNYASAMFVQNICKFGAAPPALLHHLYKQPFVRKNPLLKKMLLQHPNMPGEVKRNI